MCVNMDAPVRNGESWRCDESKESVGRATATPTHMNREKLDGNYESEDRTSKCERGRGENESTQMQRLIY
jgi:hypothetical protein